MPLDGNIQLNDVFSLEGLILWLEKQPGETAYNLMSTSDCLICRYGKAQGIKADWCGRVFLQTYAPWEKNGTADLVNKVALAKPETYAAALDRARTLLTERE